MLKVGDKAEVSKTLTEADLTLFGAVTGDFSPLHIDEEFAKKTQFGTRIAHGAINSGYISRLIGMALPGPGTIYLGQEVKFKKPCFIGDTITVKGEVTDIKQGSKFPIFTISTNCYNQKGELVTEGVAKATMAEGFF